MRRWFVLALVIPTLALAACGSSDSGPGVTPTPASSIDPRRGDCRPTTEHMPFTPVLPGYLPDGVKFLEACTHPGPVPTGAAPLENVEIYYYDDARTAWFQVVTSTLPVEPRGREAIDLNGAVGYIIRTERPAGGELYGVEISLTGRAYTVIAILNVDGNTLTEADLNQVAESMVKAAAGL